MTVKQITCDSRHNDKSITLTLSAHELWWIQKAIHNECKDKDSELTDGTLKALRRDLSLYYTLTNNGAIDDITIETLERLKIKGKD